MNKNKPIGKYLGDGRVELNDNGIKWICENVTGQMSEVELLKKINNKLKNELNNK